MPKFIVCAEITVSTYTIVEAETKEEAIKIAESREVMSVPALDRYQYDPKEMWLVEEIDGEPTNVRIEN